MDHRNPAEAPAYNSSLALLYIAGWYFFSMSISVYNKWMFGRGLNFRFPLFVTAFHQTCLFVMSTVLMYFRPHLRPTVNNAGFNFWPSLAISLRLYLRQIMPCAVASAGDIGLSNVSLEYISLSLYTMLKTSSLIFVLIFGLLFRLEIFNWRLIVIVVVMCASVVMMTRPSDAANEVDDDHQPIGIVLILAASMVLGLRWSFTQLLLKKNEYTKHPMLTIFYISPFMTLILLVFALFVEGWDDFMALPIWEVKGTWGTIGLMIIPGFLAFMMTLCEFQLLSVAQVLTLSIAGIFKELLTIMLGSMIFGDTLSLVNCIGLVITFIDILWYNYYRYMEKDTLEPTYTSIPDEEQGTPGEAIELKQQ